MRHGSSVGGEAFATAGAAAVSRAAAGLTKVNV
jgi:hypothetical protein